MPSSQQPLDRRMARRESADEHHPHRHHHYLYHDDHDDGYLSRKLSEESIRTELCEGRVPDSSPVSTSKHLIEWIPQRHFESLWDQETQTTSPIFPMPIPSPTRKDIGTTTDVAAETEMGPSPNLLPSLTTAPHKCTTTSDDERRPRSALHSGNFTQDDTSRDTSPSQHRRHTKCRPEVSGSGDGGQEWMATSPPRDFTHFNLEGIQSIPVLACDVRSALSSLSSSLSSSFVYKPPTSPLFQSESNDDLDLVSPMNGTSFASGLSRQQRRHTLMSSRATSHAFSQSSSLRQEKTFPYQAHQPRRSLTIAPDLSSSASSPQTPAFLHKRRLSVTFDASPTQHASMVGSYEESILRGRMSTTPSRPLDFLAQIGVLGLGKCKTSLRCPPHVTLSFPAVFYSYARSSHGRSQEDDGPSPYVGQVDLENGLPHQDHDARSRRKQQARAVEKTAEEEDAVATDPAPSNNALECEIRKSPPRPKRVSGSLRSPPGGSYRIPEKGQVQIIIKNANKTVVKLFLVPYDLAGMEPGTKTFVRQRTYSVGPIVDSIPHLKDPPSADRPILRYLVHLHICCPSRGRYYLYKNIRLVFANRVPDGEEKLRNEITLPEPRFTPYKSIRVMHPPSSNGTGPGASLAADKAFRRRSSGFIFGAGGRAFEHDPFSHALHTSAGGHAPVDPIQFSASTTQTGMTMMTEDGKGVSGSRLPQSPEPSRKGWDGYDGQQIDNYEKLTKGDVGYGGNAFAGIINGNPVIAESLLSQRLRSLEVQAQEPRTRD